MRPTLRHLALPIVLAAACGGELTQAPTRDAAAFTESSDGLSRQKDTGRLVVKFKNGVSSTTKASVHSGKGATKKKTLKSGAEVVSVSRASTQSILARYKSDPNVASAEIDLLQPVVRTPNDPYYSYQWQHDAIRAPAAWDTGTGSTTVLIAICDTGILLTHPDLKANLRTDLCWNTAYGTAGNCDPVDWHGTGVAGAAAAIGNNGLGVAGSTWNAQIAPLRVSNELDGSAYTTDMADCLTKAADIGAKVVNLSYQTYDAGTISQSILDAAAYAEGKGTLVVIASGNEGTQAVTSQDPTNIVYVGATTSTNAIATFSNFGPYVDVAAPGEDIVTTGVETTCVDANGNGVVNPGECTSDGGGYYYASGTSFSAPIVAGAAALLKSLKPTATPADLRSALYNSAKDISTTGQDAKSGFGLIDLGAAVTRILGTTAPSNTAPTIRITTPGNGTTGYAGQVLEVEANATDTQDGDISASIRWNFGDGVTATGSYVGNHAYAAAGTYTITASVTDSGGLSASTTISVTIASTNTPPTLTITTPSTASISVVTGTNVTFQASASDAQDGNLSSRIVWTIPGGTANAASIGVTFPTAGTFTVRADVTDLSGLPASDSVTVTVTAPASTTLSAPVLSATLGNGRKVYLRWTDPNTNETNYRVERAPVSSSGTIGTWATRTTLGANSVAFTDQPSRGSYAYRVRALNASTSTLSNTLLVTVR